MPFGVKWGRTDAQPRLYIRMLLLIEFLHFTVLSDCQQGTARNGRILITPRLVKIISIPVTRTRKHSIFSTWFPFLILTPHNCSYDGGQWNVDVGGNVLCRITIKTLRTPAARVHWSLRHLMWQVRYLRIRWENIFLPLFTALHCNCSSHCSQLNNHCCSVSQSWQS